MLSMLPQLGCGGGMPKPRKLTDASASMLPPTETVNSTIIGATICGATWRARMRRVLAPVARAAST